MDNIYYLKMWCAKTYFLFILMILSKTRAKSLRKANVARVEGFIIGGKYAKIVDFPHSAYLAIQCHKKSVEEFACGGSIINQVMLLTAGHCYANCKPATKTIVAVGDANKTRGKLFQATTFIVHPLFNGSLLRNDIALAMLAKPLKFSSAVKRVVLSKVSIYDKPAMQAGWGVTDEKRYTNTDLLKTTKQKVYSLKHCKSLLTHLEVGFICGTGFKKEKDYGYAAVGDSGSALIVRGYIQIGLVSHKIRSVSTGLIVYTEVPYYYNWILKASKALFCCSYKK